MEAYSEGLKEILFMLAAAVFVVAAFRRLNLSPVLGYLAAGVAIGPYGFSIISNLESTHYFAEFGVVFLLFYIGLELTFDRLKSMRKHVFGFGTMQLIITSVIIGLLVHYAFGESTAAAIVIGGGIALSSTAVVLQVLIDRGERATQVGRVSTAVLILQDLAVAPLLVMVPLLGARGQGVGILQTLLDAFFKGFMVLVAMLIVGRLFLRPLFRAIGSLRSQELFAALTLLIVLGAAWATASFGLSLALGAFVAGIMVAETEFRHQVEADILPFKGLLMGLFFLSVGMSINLTLLIENFYVILLLAAAVIIIKAVVIIGLCYLFKFKIGNAIYTGLILAQGSEFAFVLFGMAAELKVIPKDIAQLLLVIISITMALTPLLAAVGDRIQNYFDQQRIVNVKDASKEMLDLENHVIIAGFGRMGRTVAKLLAAENINFIALDNNPKNVYNGNKADQPVYFGDVSRADVLHSVGISRAKAVVITTNNRVTSEKALQAIRQDHPDIPVIIRAKDLENLKQLEKIGASMVIPEVFETSLQLGASVLKFIGTPDNEIERVIRLFRSEDYAFVKDIPTENEDTKYDPVI